MMCQWDKVLDQVLSFRIRISFLKPQSVGRGEGVVSEALAEFDPRTQIKSQAWWCVPVIPALGSWRQEDSWDLLTS